MRAALTYPDHVYPEVKGARTTDAAENPAMLDDYSDGAVADTVPETCDLHAPPTSRRQTLTAESFSSLPQARGALNTAALLSSLSSCSSLPTLSAVLQQIRDDSWNGKGTGEYVLPGVQSIHLGKNGGSLPTLLVNARPVGYLHGGSDGEALALKPMITGAPADLKVKGHYGNTTYYIDHIEMATPPSPTLAGIIGQIRADAWNGKGPGNYVLPGVQSIFVDRSASSLPTLMVNAKPAGYLHGGSDAAAEALSQMLGNKPHDLAVKGHYGNTAFYIDNLGFTAPMNNPMLSAALESIRKDAWNGKGPGTYDLPEVQNIHIDRGSSSSPSLMVNGRRVGYLMGDTVDTAEACQEMLQNQPHTLRVKGHYGNTAFYVDGIEITGRSPKDPIREHLEALIEDKKQETIISQRETITIEDDHVDVGGVKLERHD
jgi:RNA binding exosome subunit